MEETMDSISKSLNITDFFGMQENEDVINSSAKPQKNCEEVTIEEMKDRISSFPNQILVRILSFLPTKYAVGTCILSTRWKHLWTSLPNLDFDDWLLFDRERYIPEAEETLSFTSFVHRVLMLRNESYIRRFRLSCSDANYESSNVYPGICDALGRNIQELDLSINNTPSRIKLPNSLFSCGTLVSLELDGTFTLDVPAWVGLPKLKTLRLVSVQFRDDDSARMLFSSCPVLEELLILKCRCKNISVLSICALALKRLTIDEGILRLFKIYYEYKFIIDAPRLEYLKLAVRTVEGSSVKNVESLIEAYLRVDICDAHNDSVLELIRVISKVKILHLISYTMEAFVSFPHELPDFFKMTHLENASVSSPHELPDFLNVTDLEKAFVSSPHELPDFLNVTHLELDVYGIGCLCLPDLLENSPNLEVLSFQWEWSSKFQWRLREQVPHCLLHHLKTINMLYFRGLKEEMNLVEYFLENAKVLQQLNIRFRTCTIRLRKEEELNVRKKLLMFPRSSKTCQVEISS